MDKGLTVAFIVGCLCTLAGFVMAYLIFYFQEKKMVEREKVIQKNVVNYLTNKNKRRKEDGWRIWEEVNGWIEEYY